MLNDNTYLKTAQTGLIITLIISTLYILYSTIVSPNELPEPVITSTTSSLGQSTPATTTEVTITPTISITLTPSSTALLGVTPPVTRVIDNRNVVAFVSDRREKNNLDIWIIDIKTGQLEALTSDVAQDWHPLWSPDGTELVYLSAKTKEDVYVTVIEFDTRAVVSELYVPDVLRVSWSSDSENLWLDTYSGIWKYNIPTGTLTQFFERSRFIAESKSENLLATGIQESEGIYNYNLSIQNGQNVTFPIFFSQDILNLSLNDIGWAHTSPKLAATFQTVSRHFTGRISIFSLSDSGASFEEIVVASGDEPSLDYCRPAWSPLDNYLSYTVAWSYAKVPCLGSVYIFGIPTGQTFYISNNATITQQPWSPFNTQIVYSRNSKSPWWYPSRSFGFPGEGAIWVSNSDGTNQEILTDGDWYDGEAVWRP